MSEARPPAPPDPSAPATPEMEGEAVTRVCNACGTDIGRSCFAYIVRTMRGSEPIVIMPLRCPKCNAPLFYVQASRVHRPPS